MTLKTTLQSMTRHAFRALDGTLLPGVWMHRGLGEYDPQTGTVVAPGPQLYDVQVLVSQYKREDIDGVRVLASDRRMCIQQTALPIKPSTRDWIEIDQVVWQVIALAQDAAALTWECQTRAAGED